MSSIYIVGSINMDLVVSTDIVPEKGMTVSGYGFMTNPGGKGANQAVAVAKSGGDAKMVGCVGDAFGEELTKVLKGYGVDTSFVAHSYGVSSGIAVIVINEGDNRIILDAGANAHVNEHLIDDALATAKQGDYLIVQLEIPIDSVEYALKLGKQKGMITVLNPAPAKALQKSIFEHVDYFVPNQTETQLYTNVLPQTVAEAENASVILKGMGIKNVIITLGSQGAYFSLQNEKFLSPSFKVDAIDTTAAGDTFVGAFVTRLATGDTPEQAATYANKASSITVTRHGAQQAIPTKDEIEQ